MDVSGVLEKTVKLAKQAGEAILPIYRNPEDYQVRDKPDSSPVTAADMAAHHLLLAGLPKILDVPILSEESDIPDYEERAAWSRYWLVDPLDGTREFIAGNGEFTVNIALIEQGYPILGVVYVPVSGDCYAGGVGVEAQKNGVLIHCRPVEKSESVTVVASRRHGSEAVKRVIGRLQKHWGIAETCNIGSSLKFCLLAEGRADCYPRLAPTCEWDTAAAQAVLEAAGGCVVDCLGARLIYNQKADLLNPHFVAAGANSDLLEMVLSELAP